MNNQLYKLSKVNLYVLITLFTIGFLLHILYPSKIIFSIIEPMIGITFISMVLSLILSNYKTFTIDVFMIFYHLISLIYLYFLTDKQISGVVIVIHQVLISSIYVIIKTRNKDEQNT